MGTRICYTYSKRLFKASPIGASLSPSEQHTHTKALGLPIHRDLSPFINGLMTHRMGVDHRERGEGSTNLSLSLSLCVRE